MLVACHLGAVRSTRWTGRNRRGIHWTANLKKNNKNKKKRL